MLEIASRPPRDRTRPFVVRSPSYPFFLSAHEMIIANVHATTSYTVARNGSADCKSVVRNDADRILRLDFTLALVEIEQRSRRYFKYFLRNSATLAFQIK